ncbi:MAG: hypothetical protein ACK559_33015, partial [bacterium]
GLQHGALDLRPQLLGPLPGRGDHRVHVGEDLEEQVPRGGPEQVAHDVGEGGARPLEDVLPEVVDEQGRGGGGEDPAHGRASGAEGSGERGWNAGPLPPLG